MPNILIFAIVLLSSTQLIAAPAPEWTKRFWDNIDAHDLRIGCTPRAKQLLANAKNRATSPRVPQAILDDLRYLVLMKDPALENGPSLYQNEIPWTYHTVITYEQNGTRYILDGGFPNEVFEYTDWLNTLTRGNVGAFRVAMERNLYGIGMSGRRPVDVRSDDGRVILPAHPIFALPQETLKVLFGSILAYHLGKRN